MKNKDKYDDLKRMYAYVDHDYSNGGVEIECILRYKEQKEPVFKDTFKVDSEDVLFKQTWIDLQESIIETILEWLEEEAD